MPLRLQETAGGQAAPEGRGTLLGAGLLKQCRSSPGRALWSSPWCPGSSPGIVLPPGTIAGSRGTSCDPTRSTAPRCHRPLSPASPGQALPSWPNTWGQESSRATGSCCCRGQGWRLCVGTAGLQQRVRGLTFPSHGAQAASAPSVAAMDPARCGKDGTGAAGAFPDRVFRECPSLGEAGGCTLHVCECVCTRGSQVWTRVCAIQAPRAPAQPLGSAPAWPATSSPWHRLPLPLSLSVLGAAFQGGAAFLGVPRVPRHCFPIGEVWLAALPSWLRPSLTLCQGRTRGYGTGPPLEVVFCHVKPQHLPGSSPPSSLAPSVHPPWCGSIHPAWPCCYCRCRDRRGCSGRPNPFVHDHCDSPGREQEKFTLGGFWRCGQVPVQGRLSRCPP